MARLRITDPLQGYPFWLVDVSPSPVAPFFALNPLLGFSAISSPEINVENNAYRPVNRMYPVHMPRSAQVNPITCRRAALFTAKDFYRWVTNYVDGTDNSRRNLLLIQFHGMSTDSLAGGLAAALDLNAIGVGAPFVGDVRVPARAWVLWNAVPTRYSSGELDGKSSDVTLSELTIQPEKITETVLGVPD